MNEIVMNAFFDELQKIAAVPIASGIGIVNKIGRFAKRQKLLKGALASPAKMETAKKMVTTIKKPPVSRYTYAPKKVGEITDKSMTLFKPQYSW